MNRRQGLFVLAAVIAFALSAIAASGASAKGITAFACEEVAVNTGEFTNHDCSSKTEEEGGKLKPKNWVHSEIAPNAPIQLTATPVGVLEFKTKIGLVNVVMKPTSVECVKCMVDNHKEKIKEEEVMVLNGSGGHLHYTGVTTNVTNCKVAGGEINTEPLKVSGVMKPESEFYEFEFARTEPGTVFAEVTFENSGGTCPLGGVSPIKIEGHVNAKETGAFVKIATGTGELTVGSQILTLTSELTVLAGVTPTPEEPNPFHRPIGLTTTAT